MNVARFRARSSVFVHGVSVGFPWGGLALLGVSDSIDNVCFRIENLKKTAVDGSGPIDP